mgnify:FL=1|jgi:hypothetical protein
MEAFDKVEELLLAEGYSKEEIPAIMVSLVEQGMSPTEIVGRGIIDMLNLLPKKRKPEPLPKTKAVADLLPDRQQPKAPKPEFGPSATKPQTRVKPELRPGGRTPEPQFRTTQPRTNAGGATSIPRTNANTRVVQPQAPAPKFGTTPTTPAAPKGNLFTRLKSLATPQNLVKGIRGVGGALGSLGAQSAGIEIATKLAQTMGKPGQSRMSMFGAERGDAPVYNTPFSPNNVADAKASGYVPNKGFLNTVGKTSPQPAPQPKSPSLTQQQVNRDNQRYGNTVPSGSFGISQQGRAQAAANRAAVQSKVAPTPPTPTPAPPAPPVPKLTAAQQAVNTEYDKLRKSNPADAVKYGLKMARAGASKSSFKLPK